MIKNITSTLGTIFLVIVLIGGLMSTSVAFAAEEEKKSEVPDWVKKIKFKGDLRLRYQNDDQEGKDKRDRLRYRYRIGAFADITDTTTVGFGIASGGDDPRSTNQTFEDTFSTKDARMDYAYVEYRPGDWLTLFGGKIKGTPFFTAQDLLWDTDINPEGVAANFQWGGDVKEFIYTGYFILDEWKTSLSDNPLMMVVQPGINWKFGNGHLTVGAAFYKFDNVQDHPYLDFSSETNSVGDIDLNGDGTIETDEEDLLLYKYNSYAVDADFGYKFEGPIAYFGIMANYVSNSDPDSENTGYLFGFHVGDEKLKKRGDWLVKAMYRSLERDAFLDTFPDSDAYDGKTGVRGIEFIAEFGIAKNTTFGIDYYDIERIIDAQQTSKVPKKVLQLDFIWKF